MAESAILRTEKNAKRFGEEAQSVQIAMAKLYLYHAVDIVEEKGKESIISFAEGDEQRMMLMGLKTFYKIYKLSRYCRFTKRNCRKS